MVAGTMWAMLFSLKDQFIEQRKGEFVTDVSMIKKNNKFQVYKNVHILWWFHYNLI